jgi:orotate phosphoribosyltransferase
MNDPQNDPRDEVLEAFRSSGALLHGHFILRSGLHSREFFQCALLLQDAALASKICGMLADRLAAFPAQTVISPAVGGILVGQEIARHLGKRHIFAEKDASGSLVLKRGFSITPGERFLVAEDVVTRGGRVMETISIVRERGGIVSAAGAIVNRGAPGALPDFGCPFVSLVQMTPETFSPGDIPPDLASIRAVKPGS